MFYCLQATSLVLPKRNAEVNKARNLYSMLVTKIPLRHAADIPL
jgi:hypothetical protein